MKLQFIGTGSVVPEPGRESACFVVNDRCLVDAGWCAPLKLAEYGVDPLGIRTLILTHFHQDHYLGLPHLLFYRAMRGGSEAEKQALQIMGPAGRLEKIVRAAKQFLQCDRFPELDLPLELTPITPGESVDLEDLQLRTCLAKHTSGVGVPEEALSGLITEAATGELLAFSGDTSYNPPLEELARGAGVLIHDAAHTRPADAARTALNAGVGRLFLIHYPQHQAAQFLSEARAIFDRSYLAEAGTVHGIER